MVLAVLGGWSGGKVVLVAASLLCHVVVSGLCLPSMSSTKPRTSSSPSSPSTAQPPRSLTDLSGGSFAKGAAPSSSTTTSQSSTEKLINEALNVQEPLPLTDSNGFELALGRYRVNPFLARTLAPQHLFGVQTLQSDDDPSFGAAFLSLRSATADGPSAQKAWRLGRPNATRLIALHRFKLWWMMPVHVSRSSEVPPETQMLIAELPPDPQTGKKLYSIFIPLLDGPAKCSLKGQVDGSLQLLAETGCASVPVPPSDLAGIFVAVHDDIHELVEKSCKLVQSHLGLQIKGGAMGGLVRGAEQALYQLKRQEVIRWKSDTSAPDFSKYLGWCTWDSFYTSVDNDKVVNGLKSLRAAGIQPRWLVLDDGWQSTSNVDAENGEQWMDHLTSLKANSKFRDEDAGTDLSKTVTKAKTEFGIDYFFVWHAITGYWAGVDLDSPHLNKYSPRRARLNAPPGIIEIDPDMKMFFRVCRFMNKRFGVVPPTHIRSFYDDYHSYLRSQGVDGVKVDAQSVVNFIAPGHGGSVALSRAYHQALSKSVIEHFSDKDGPKGAGGRIIHCMCHDNEILLQLPSCYGRRPLIRGSDDFYPRDAASHGTHLYSNAFNGMLLARCGLQDWDMFQTNLGPASWLHAASRAISGGPVYISDRPGNHNTDILRRMVLDDGSILRPLGNALPIARTLFDDPQSDPDALLTVWNENAVQGHGVLGTFNIYGSSWNQNRRMYTQIAGYNEKGNVIDGVLSPRDCHSLMRNHQPRQARLDIGSDRFATYCHMSRRLVVGGLDDEVKVSLAAQEFEVAAIAKVLHVGPERVEWASIGLADYFNAGGAIVSEEVDDSAVSLSVVGSGRFLAYCGARPYSVQVDGSAVPFEFSEATAEGPSGLEFQLPSPYEGILRHVRISWQGA